MPTSPGRRLDPLPDTRARLINRDFVVLSTAAALFFIGQGASNPLIPKFVVDELGGTEAIAGMVMGSVAISALLTRSWLGRLGDRRGARRLMVIGCSFACVGMAVLACTTTVLLAVVSRLIVGAAQAAVMIGATVLAIDISPESRRSEAAAYVLVAFHLGLGLGPVAGELLLDLFSYRTVWLQISALSAAGAAVAMLLPHRPGDLDAPPSPWVHAAGIAPGLVQAFGVVAFVAFMTFLPLYGRSIGVEQVGTVFATGSVTIGIVRVVLGRTLDSIGPIRADAMALASTLVGALIVASWSSAAGLYVGVVFLAGGMALQTPSLIPVAVNGVEKAQRSSALATFTMFMDLSVALTAPIVGIIVSGVGYRAAFLATAMTTLISFALLFGMVAPRWRAASRPLATSRTL